VARVDRAERVLGLGQTHSLRPRPNRDVTNRRSHVPLALPDGFGPDRHEDSRGRRRPGSQAPHPGEPRLAPLRPDLYALPWSTMRR
jgi:hypothetical protein